MNKRIFLTEQQISEVIDAQILTESMFNKNMSFMDILKTVKKLGARKLLTTALIASIALYFGLNDTQKKKLEAVAEEDRQEAPVEKKNKSVWELASTNVKGTVYNAVPEQCNDDVMHTASMFRLDLDNVGSHRIIAMERTFMKELGLHYGDVVKVEGTGNYDGVWQIQDTMNRRFAGQKKIDFLVPENIKYGKWDDIKLYKLADNVNSSMFKKGMAPQLSKEAAAMQAMEISREMAASQASDVQESSEC